MLDELRRHATSWIVKGVLTLIILTFIFFFGYSQISSRYRHEQNFIAMVGKEGIPRRRFEKILEVSRDRMREGLKGEIPESMENFLEQNIIHQLVSRELVLRYADRLGLSVSDDEVAAAIRADRSLFPEGDFDLTAYEERFLPSYRQRYGEDFEEMRKRDLLIEKVETLLPILFGPWQEELNLSTLSPQEVFSFWLDHLGKETTIEVFRR